MMYCINKSLVILGWFSRWCCSWKGCSFPEGFWHRICWRVSSCIITGLFKRCHKVRTVH